MPSGRSAAGLFARLSDPALYLAAAERMRARQRASGQWRSLGAGASGPYLQLLRGDNPLARLIAREVGEGRYTFSAVTPRAAYFDGKRRTLYQAPALDELVQTALAGVCAEVLEHSLSDRVFSYRRGRSAFGAVAEFSTYLRDHGRRHPDPRSRGLYVIRRDIRGYGDAIPSGPDSRFWPLLADAFARAGLPLSAAEERWLRRAFRPGVRAPSARAGELFEHGDDRAGPSDAGAAIGEATRGIPTGSPLQPAACNVYLGPLDRICAGVPQAFYARYGDDLLFAHVDPDIARAIAGRLDAEIAQLGLELSAGKCGSYFFSRPGRASERAPDFRGTSRVDYLGLRVGFGGATGLKREKATQLLRDLRLRLEQTAAAGALPLDQLARLLCTVVNLALDPDHPACNRSAGWLRYVVSDRDQLRDLDQRIALLVAERLGGTLGVRAFRRHPPRQLRSDHGLRSLVYARDRARRGRDRAARGAAGE